jgi:hypothetical protein
VRFSIGGEGSLEWAMGQSSFSGSRRLSNNRAAFVKEDLEFIIESKPQEDGGFVDQVTLYHDNSPTHILQQSIVGTFDSERTLIKAVTDNPSEFFHALLKYVDENISAKDDLANVEVLCTRAETARNEAIQTKEATDRRIEEVTAQLQAAQTGQGNEEDKKNLAKARRTIERLRLERQELQETVTQLTTTPAAPQTFNYDSDDEVSRRGQRQTTPGGASVVTNATARTNTTNMRPSKSNSRWPDAFIYHGKPTEDIDQWEAACLLKFRNSWEQYETEWNKIEYCGARTADDAYTVIKDRGVTIVPDTLR